jgi:exodeoxyribonuclease-3
MKFISWNVNGFRAVLGKGFADIFSSLDADFFCLQETKMQEGQADFSPEGYKSYWFSAEKKGYSGTAVFTKHEPISVSYGIEGKHNDEGRVITLEYDEFYLVCAYVPNAQDGLKRIDYRMEFEDDMRAYLSKLDSSKGVIYCGDLNVARNEIDLKNPKANIGNAGFSYEERGKLEELLGAGFTDTYRYLYPDTVKYSWWSYRFRARENNAGWRIDYFLVSERLASSIRNAEILTDIMGSDHCPVLLETI